MQQNNRSIGSASALFLTVACSVNSPTHPCSQISIRDKLDNYIVTTEQQMQLSFYVG